MNIDTIIELEKALETSPENEILRRQIANAYLALREFEHAKRHYNYLVEHGGKSEAKLGLAKSYLGMGSYGTGIIICEELVKHSLSEELAEVYVKLLIADNNLDEASTQYQLFQKELRGWKVDSLEEQLKLPQMDGEFDEDFDEPEEDLFMEKPKLNFDDVGGMEHVKGEIRMKIIEPIENPELFEAFGKKAGGGILLYGPPGCGKTYLARATAGQISSNFMSIGINDTIDMWTGNTEKNLHHRFEKARKSNPCVMFFDEIDALGSKRVDLKNSGSRSMVNQFLKELDGVDTNNEGVLILGATNAPWHMDSAFLRPGRFDRIIFVPPPDEEARELILKLLLEKIPQDKIDLGQLAKKTDGLSGADMKLLIDYAVEENLKKSMEAGKIVELTNKVLLKAAAKVKPSTKEWFNTAKNYVMFSNSSGLYDDVKNYMSSNMEMISQERIYALIELNKFDDAHQLINEALAQNPNDDELHSLRSLAYSGAGDYVSAVGAIELAIEGNPEDPYHYYNLARFELQLNQYNKALKSVEACLGLESGIAEFIALKALVLFSMEKKKEALVLIADALAIDPQSTYCRNIKAMIQNQVEDTSQTVEELEDLLEENPNDAFTHANMGYNLLSKGKVKEAQKHFALGLQINPEDPYTRSGMEQALKAKYWLYAKLLQFSYFIERTAGKNSWAVWIGFIFIVKVLPILLPIYYLFIMWAWFTPPIINMLFYFDPYGKHLLDEEDKRSVEINLGLSALVVVGTTIGIFFYPANHWLLLAMGAFMTLIPVHQYVESSNPKRKMLMGAFAVLFMGIALYGASAASFGGESISNYAVAIIFSGVAFSWLASLWR